jgi:hypothetical protein
MRAPKFRLEKTPSRLVDNLEIDSGGLENVGNAKREKIRVVDPRRRIRPNIRNP